MRVGVHPIEMSDVAIGAVDALARESREPTAACRVEIGNVVDIARAQTLFRSVKSTLVCRGRREVQQSRGGSGARVALQSVGYSRREKAAKTAKFHRILHSSDRNSRPGQWIASRTVEQHAEFALETKLVRYFDQPHGLAIRAGNARRSRWYPHNESHRRLRRPVRSTRRHPRASICSCASAQCNFVIDPPPFSYA